MSLFWVFSGTEGFSSGFLIVTAFVVLVDSIFSFETFSTRAGVCFLVVSF